jgi:hypothetical protein
VIAWLKKIPNWLLLTAVAFFALHYIESRGYERRDAEVRIELAAAQARYQAELAHNTEDARRREQALTEQLEAANETARKRSQSLAAHLKAQEQQPLETRHARSDESRTLPQPETAAHGDPGRPLLGRAVLDGRTVRLLNDARTNRPGAQDGSAAPSADEEGRATAVTGTDFALNDLEVVRLYHELAARHNGLVDWVLHQCVDPTPSPKAP